MATFRAGLRPTFRRGLTLELPTTLNRRNQALPALPMTAHIVQKHLPLILPAPDSQQIVFLAPIVAKQVGPSNEIWRFSLLSRDLTAGH